MVGGVAFAVDFSCLFILETFLLKNLPFSLYISAALAFIAGLCVNYICSLLFVFKKVQDKKHSHLKDFLLFTVIGIIGLLLTELGIHVGVAIWNWHYLAVKVIVAGMVLIWNYAARKILIFS